MPFLCGFGARALASSSSSACQERPSRWNSATTWRSLLNVADNYARMEVR